MDHTLRDQAVPNHENNGSTKGRTDQTGSLIGPIPAEALANPGRNECARNPKRGRQYEALGIIRSR
jgi:hypothetical protein